MIIQSIHQSCKGSFDQSIHQSCKGSSKGSSNSIDQLWQPINQPINHLTDQSIYPIAACLAWVLIPHQEWTVDFYFKTLSSWRLFVLLCVLPALSAALLLLFFPESPKFLIKSGRGPEAKSVFSYIIKTNGGSTVDDLQSTLFADNTGSVSCDKDVRFIIVFLIVAMAQRNSLFHPFRSL